MSTRKETINNLGRIWNKTCIFLTICYGNPITRGKREENKFHSILSKGTYNLSIFNFILLYSYWNDKLEIWTFTGIVFCLRFFILFNKIILLLILLTQTRQFIALFYWKELYLSKTLYLRGKAGQLVVLTFHNSPRTQLVALKCGSAWEMLISVTLNSVRQTTAKVCSLL